MRTSSDQLDGNGVLKNGYDYKKQCWIKDYIIQRCGHPENNGRLCSCYGRYHEGADIRTRIV